MIAEKRWVLKAQGDPGKTQILGEKLGISPALANLLVQRGIDTAEKAEDFFNPQLHSLHDPFLMKDMEQAVQRIGQAVTQKQKIMVYGDYDVDGTTAVALMYSFLRSIGHGDDNLSFYIPDRYAEGYGISYKALDLAAEKGVKLIIALDCGIKAVDKVEYARQRGMDFIICDHHLPGDVIPKAAAVLDPKRVDCRYPFKELSGCGVGFKLIQGYAQRSGIPSRNVEVFLDLVVVSIASDIVPVTGENRVLAYFGLKQLNSNPNKGLLSIIKICGLEKHEITIDDLVFKIGPRINAAGRMEFEDEGVVSSGGDNAVRLLISSTDEKAVKYGNIIDTCNTGRKEIDRSITIEAQGFIDHNGQENNPNCTVIYHPGWMKGVVGIVASRLIERYYRPTVVLTMSNGMITGSARSVPGFDLYQAVESCADLLENFGGHTYAAGLAMKPENFERFKQRFEAYVDKHIDPEMLVPKIEADAMLNLEEISSEFRKTLSRFQPFGPGNQAPVFITQQVYDYGNGRCVGNNAEHLKLDIISYKLINPISAIAFQQCNSAKYALSGKMFDICYTIVENSYRGEVKPQLRIKDIKPSMQ